MSKSVVFSTCTRIACAGQSNPVVVLCLDSTDLLAPIECAPPSADSPFDFSTIEGTLTKVYRDAVGCDVISWRYVVSYDENLLADPTTALTSTNITGIFCKGCLTTWVEEKVGDEVYILTEGDSQTLVTQHGCEYPLTGGGGSAVLPYVLIDTLSYDGQEASPTTQSVVVPTDAIYVPAYFVTTITSGTYVDLSMDISVNGTVLSGVYQAPPLVGDPAAFDGTGLLAILTPSTDIDFNPAPANSAPLTLSIKFYAQAFPL